MVEWFKAHVFIAAWASPLIALAAMMFKKSPAAGAPLNWARAMMYVGFLTALAIIVTPGLDAKTQELGRTMAGFGFGSLIWFAMRS